MILCAVLLLLFVIHTQAYVNLALAKPAWQQKNWSGKEIDWGANKSVDGHYSDRSAQGNQCTISGPGQRRVTLRVDLQSVVSISHINIFYRKDNYRSPGPYFRRFAGFFVYVSNTTVKDDGYLCFHEIQNVHGTPTENQTISCPVHGRYVIYYNERKPGVTYPSYYSADAYTELCELEVYGCPDQGYYGENCDIKCPGNCQEERCNISTGECLGCLPGYKGPICSQMCNQQTYGLGCSLSCGNCSDRVTCHHVNGTCLRGCSEGADGETCQNACHPGYYGKDCIQECSVNCGVIRRCNRFTGECYGGCQPGWKGNLCDKECDGEMYGMYCNQSCGHCLTDSQCHHVNGTCSQGCSAGYIGLLCNEECDAGKYGVNCKQSCGHCVNDSECHHIDGTCLKGCSPGYQGSLCIKECVGRLYGVNCKQTCGHCVNNSQCHHVNGSCLQGCSSGYEGSYCLNDCRQSYWGENCKKNCSTDCVNRICHHESGVCETYVKPQKMSDTCNYDYTVTVTSVIVSVLIVLIGSVLNFLFWRRNQQKAKDFKSFRQKHYVNENLAVNIAGLPPLMQNSEISTNQILMKNFATMQTLKSTFNTF